MNEELQHFWIKITADKKKFTIMCALAAVGLLLWARLFILENVTRSGYADPNKAAVEAGGETSGEGTTKSRTQTPRRVIYVDVAQGPVRNLFAAPKGFFPQSIQTVAPEVEEPKSEPDTPEVPVETAEQRAQRIQQEADKLTLGSIMLGRKPIAVINGDIRTVGDKIDGFSLKEINARSVILVKEGARVELTMKVPGA